MAFIPTFVLLNSLETDLIFGYRSSKSLFWIVKHHTGLCDDKVVILVLDIFEYNIDHMDTSRKEVFDTIQDLKYTLRVVTKC